MPETKKARRPDLAGLFKNHIGLRTCIDGILQGRFGQICTDGEPSASICLTVGPFVFFGGDCCRPAVDAWLKEMTDFRVVLVEGEDWHAKIMAGESAGKTVVERHAFSARALESERLRALAATTPEGIEVRALDADLCRRMLAEVNDDLVPDLFWDPPEIFHGEGFGYCALAGERVVAGITSALLTDAEAGIQINTNEDQRGKGIATVLGATFIQESLRRGIEPHWDTGDAVSYRLAEKLGFEPLGAYRVIEWEPAKPAGENDE